MRGRSIAPPGWGDSKPSTSAREASSDGACAERERAGTDDGALALFPGWRERSDDVAFVHHGLATGGSDDGGGSRGGGAARPEQGEEEPDRTHDHQDDADRVEIESLGVVDGDCELEDRADGDQEDARADAHVLPNLLGPARPG